jgi:hypothetical protein
VAKCGADAHPVGSRTETRQRHRLWKVEIDRSHLDLGRPCHHEWFVSWSLPLAAADEGRSSPQLRTLALKNADVVANRTKKQAFRPRNSSIRGHQIKTLSSLSDVPRMAYDWRMGGDRHVR